MVSNKREKVQPDHEAAIPNPEVERKGKLALIFIKVYIFPYGS